MRYDPDAQLVRLDQRDWQAHADGLRACGGRLAARLRSRVEIAAGCPDGAELRLSPIERAMLRTLDERAAASLGPGRR